MDELDVLKRARFDLLSAYMDGEVTAAERQQVEDWLATDPEIQRLHRRLLVLHNAFQHLPVPEPERPVEQTLEQVLARIDRRPKLTLLWGGLGTAIAAVLMATVSGLFSGDSWVPQMAQQSGEQSPLILEEHPLETLVSGNGNPPALMIALDRPPIEIPETGTTPLNDFASPDL